MVIGFITTYAVSAYIAINDGSSNPAKTRLPIQHYVIKFVSCLPMVSGSLRVLRSATSSTTQTGRHDIAEKLLNWR
jgi:hypothetical protein